MTTHTHDTRPLPAPLPYASQAGRGEIPAPPTAPPAAPEDPDAPLLREDERSMWLTIGTVVFLIVIMMIIAASGGL